MKISDFADQYGVSNDTVRYYMKLNLVTPEKKGGHYHFDEKCKKQLEEILRLKRMNFSLQEIKEIFHFKRVGKLTTYQQNNYYQGLYQSKLEEINDKLTKLTAAKKQVKEEIANLKRETVDNKRKIGVNLSSLSLFSCPQCSSELLLSAEKVEANQVLAGSLNCECGYSLQIKDGIVYDSKFVDLRGKVEANHIVNYIKNTNSDFIDQSYQRLDWLQRKFEPETWAGKVILEPGSGYGYFLRQIYSDLPKDCVYICVDHNPQRNQYLKNLLEATGKRSKVIFITTDLPELPLKNNIVDLLIDFTGTSCFSFANQDFLPSLLNCYLQQQVTLLAVFIIYLKFGSNNIVDKPYRKNFIADNIRERLLSQDFKLKTEYKSEPQLVDESIGQYESFAQSGDKIASYQVQAKRWS